MSAVEENDMDQDEGNKTNFPLLLKLSEDLKAIFDQGLMSDIVLVVNERFIKCHKDILIFRSKWFSLKIRSASALSPAKSLKIKESDHILDAVLAYIYTGNLKVLESFNIPLIELRTIADKYGLTKLKDLLTNIIKSEKISDKTISMEFFWTVKVETNASFVSDASILENFSLFESDKWGLEIQPLFLADGACIIEVYLTRKTSAEAPKAFHLVKTHVQIVDLYESRQISFEREWAISEDGKYKIAEFSPVAKKQVGILIPNNMITLAFKLTNSGWLSNLETLKFTDHYQKHMTKELINLSKDMYQMMKFGKYFDTSILLKGCRLLRVHSYIVVARSLIPSISCLSKLGDILGFGSIIWMSFIFYLYTGQTRYLDDHMRFIYSALKRSNLSDAGQKYSNILAVNLNVTNALDILGDAIKYEDSELILRASNFLASNSNSLPESTTWINIANDTLTKIIFHSNKSAMD